MVPALIGLVASLVWVLAGERRGLTLFLPVPTLTAAIGVLVSLLAAVWILVSWMLARAKERGRSEQAEQQVLEHRQFLARLDHELKNPLTAILAAAASEGPQSMQIVTAQARRMGVLVTDLRKLSDLSSAPLDLEDVDLEEAATDAVEAARAAVGGAREFVLVFPKAPWPLPRVRGDADLLYSALQNVVMNAVKYSDVGARIEVRGSQVESAVQVEVADTGIGVPAADVRAVWSELARGSNTMGRQGSGLGLALVRIVVDKHGGTVRLTSREAVGTSVTMTFPIAGPTSSP
ncbi:HAMP domain-containing histidine kinase [Schaalia sp. 19OD2882]|nr:HAMP domain-containing histidine kinase [Schaalia sp. 19OD2882]